jgi:3-hydroxyacyl-[acyl-carrier-protein] dehydratase
MRRNLAEDSATIWQQRINGGVPVDAACVEGHFPGKPIVPGAVLLGFAARLLAEYGFDLVTIRRLKFLQPLPPGRSFTVQARPKNSHAEIAWLDDDTVIARANVDLRAHDV